MHIFKKIGLKKIGVIGGIAALLFSVTLVFAKGRPANFGLGIYGQQSQSERPGFGASRAPGGRLFGNNASSTPQRGIPSNIQQSVQMRREQGWERAAQRREKAQRRVVEIRDKVKQQIATHLIAQFDHINKVWTDHFAQLLDRYDAILQKIQDRANIAASIGKDVSATTAAIKSAKTAIAAARSAIEAQAAKTYTIDTSTATAPTAATSTPEGQRQLMQSLRSSFQTMRDQLFKDLFSLRDGPMTDARKSIQSALQTLGQIPGVDRGNATSTESENNRANQ